MKYAYTVMSLVLAVPALADNCAYKCIESYNSCQSKSGANMAQCASEYASCLGYNPFSGNTYTTPTACSQGMAPTPYPPKPYPTPSSESYPSPYPNPSPYSKPAPYPTPAGNQDCAKSCEEKFYACRNRYGTNIATCSSEKAACMASCGQSRAPAPPPYPTPAGKKDCAQTCEEKFNGCRNKYGANISTCSSEKAACLAACGQTPAPTTKTDYSSETSIPVYVAGGENIKPTVAGWTFGLGALMMFL
ncbi:hypothetical protein XA68_10444 [Ophiocordyceps unilateralis]|uniref:Uncharacterized protein n=1 Tax=Ophiocordyceps unilateralis TaxID=268505 RepID=A0A2A9PIT9_OPHUN|nr:hypothetical protein XA68_10444 [Ophiocordyceps unilateralis]